MLPLVARQADAWHAFGSADSMARKSKLLDQYAEQAGRDPRRILRSSSLSISETLDQARRKAERLTEAGFGYLVVSWPAEGRRKVEEFAGAMMSGQTV
jgi:alkanesulfonate monooxygenase SsuD/methylene tetrahydromethanopterin reductase-like flavin-dependent oxidoreductase (luciferase family)